MKSEGPTGLSLRALLIPKGYESLDLMHNLLTDKEAQAASPCPLVNWCAVTAEQSLTDRQGSRGSNDPGHSSSSALPAKPTAVFLPRAKLVS